MGGRTATSRKMMISLTLFLLLSPITLRSPTLEPLIDDSLLEDGAQHPEYWLNIFHVVDIAPHGLQRNNGFDIPFTVETGRRVGRQCGLEDLL
jgi:hypothetical protein